MVETVVFMHRPLPPRYSHVGCLCLGRAEALPEASKHHRHCGVGRLPLQFKSMEEQQYQREVGCCRLPSPCV